MSSKVGNSQVDYQYVTADAAVASQHPLDGFASKTRLQRCSLQLCKYHDQETEICGGGKEGSFLHKVHWVLRANPKLGRRIATDFTLLGRSHTAVVYHVPRACPPDEAPSWLLVVKRSTYGMEGSTQCTCTPSDILNYIKQVVFLADTNKTMDTSRSGDFPEAEFVEQCSGSLSRVFERRIVCVELFFSLSLDCDVLMVVLSSGELRLWMYDAPQGTWNLFLSRSLFSPPYSDREREIEAADRGSHTASAENEGSFGSAESESRSHSEQDRVRVGEQVICRRIKSAWYSATKKMLLWFEESFSESSAAGSTSSIDATGVGSSRVARCTLDLQNRHFVSLSYAKFLYIDEPASANSKLRAVAYGIMGVWMVLTDADMDTKQERSRANESGEALERIVAVRFYHYDNCSSQTLRVQTKWPLYPQSGTLVSGAAVDRHTHIEATAAAFRPDSSSSSSSSSRAGSHPHYRSRQHSGVSSSGSSGVSENPGALGMSNAELKDGSIDEYVYITLGTAELLCVRFVSAIQTLQVAAWSSLKGVLQPVEAAHTADDAADDAASDAAPAHTVSTADEASPEVPAATHAVCDISADDEAVPEVPVTTLRLKICHVNPCRSILCCIFSTCRSNSAKATSTTSSVVCIRLHHTVRRSATGAALPPDTRVDAVLPCSYVSLLNLNHLSSCMGQSNSHKGFGFVFFEDDKEFTLQGGQHSVFGGPHRGLRWPSSHSARVRSDSVESHTQFETFEHSLSPPKSNCGMPVAARDCPSESLFPLLLYSGNGSEHLLWQIISEPSMPFVVSRCWDQSNPAELSVRDSGLTALWDGAIVAQPRAPWTSFVAGQQMTEQKSSPHSVQEEMPLAAPAGMENAEEQPSGDFFTVSRFLVQQNAINVSAFSDESLTFTSFGLDSEHSSQKADGNADESDFEEYVKRCQVQSYSDLKPTKIPEESVNVASDHATESATHSAGTVCEEEVGLEWVNHVDFVYLTPFSGTREDTSTSSHNNQPRLSFSSTLKEKIGLDALLLLSEGLGAAVRHKDGLAPLQDTIVEARHTVAFEELVLELFLEYLKVGRRALLVELVVQLLHLEHSVVSGSQVPATAAGAVLLEGDARLACSDALASGHAGSLVAQKCTEICCLFMDSPSFDSTAHKHCLLKILAVCQYEPSRLAALMLQHGFVLAAANYCCRVCESADILLAAAPESILLSLEEQQHQQQQCAVVTVLPVPTWKIPDCSATARGTVWVEPLASSSSSSAAAAAGVPGSRSPSRMTPPAHTRGSSSSGRGRPQLREGSVRASRNPEQESFVDAVGASQVSHAAGIRIPAEKQILRRSSSCSALVDSGNHIAAGVGSASSDTTDGPFPRVITFSDHRCAVAMRLFRNVVRHLLDQLQLRQQNDQHENEVKLFQLLQLVLQQRPRVCSDIALCGIVDGYSTMLHKCFLALQTEKADQTDLAMIIGGDGIELFSSTAWNRFIRKH